MQTITWRVVYTALPTALRYCKKCKAKAGFYPSGQFRVNANQKLLDVWLIYKCNGCNATWNLPLLIRKNVAAIPAELLPNILNNNAATAAAYAANTALLKQNGAQVALPPFAVEGPLPHGEQETAIVMLCASPPGPPIAKIVRQKLCISQTEYVAMVHKGNLRALQPVNLLKGRLAGPLTLVFAPKAQSARPVKQARA